MRRVTVDGLGGTRTKKKKGNGKDEGEESNRIRVTVNGLTGTKNRGVTGRREAE